MDICPLLRELFPEIHSRRVLNSAAALRVCQESSPSFLEKGLKDTFRTPVINENGKVDGILGVSMRQSTADGKREEDVEAGAVYPVFSRDSRQVGILSIGLGQLTPVVFKANRGAEIILGHSRSEIVDFPVTMFMAAGDDYTVTGAIRRLFAEGGGTFSRRGLFHSEKRHLGQGDAGFEPSLLCRRMC